MAPLRAGLRNLVAPSVGDRRQARAFQVGISERHVEAPDRGHRYDGGLERIGPIQFQRLVPVAISCERQREEGRGRGGTVGPHFGSPVGDPATVRQLIDHVAVLGGDRLELLIDDVPRALPVLGRENVRAFRAAADDARPKDGDGLFIPLAASRSRKDCQVGSGLDWRMNARC